MECLNEMLARNVRMLPDRPFIIADEETLTYAEFDRRTKKIGSALSACGVKKGDCVGLYLPSGLTMALGFWAAQQIGAVPAPMTAMFRAGEVRAIVEQSAMAAMIVDATTAPIVAPLGVLVNIVLMLFLPLDTWGRLVVWLALGLILYFSFGYRFSIMRQREADSAPSVGPMH